MQLRIVPSPTDLVLLRPYVEQESPVFEELLRRSAESPALKAIARPLERASEAVSLENRSTKAVTALGIRWTFLDADGKDRTRKVFNDSYLVHPLRPVVDAGEKILLSTSGSLKEGLVKHVLAGGGFISSGSGRRSVNDAIEVWFQIDLVLFTDGEIAGSDPDRYAVELQLRKRAGEYVAAQIRSALAEGRDPEPVLRALQDLPLVGGEHLPQLISRDARLYLQHSVMQAVAFDPREAALKNLESRPALPKLYRRDKPEDH